jgi:molecular chaperone GrpE
MSQEQDHSASDSNFFADLGDGSRTDAEQIAALQSALAAKADECTGLNEKYLRLAAEFENYKRIAQRDQRDQIRFGNEQLLKEMLPVVDNLERAIKASRDNGGLPVLLQGVDLTLKQLSGTLAKFGVQAVETVGLAFDPSTQQAVSQTPSDKVPQNYVLDEYQKGYKLHDRILRAAMVSVSSGPAGSSEQDTTTN